MPREISDMHTPKSLPLFKTIIFRILLSLFVKAVNYLRGLKGKKGIVLNYFLGTQHIATTQNKDLKFITLSAFKWLLLPKSTIYTKYCY